MESANQTQPNFLFKIRAEKARCILLLLRSSAFFFSFALLRKRHAPLRTYLNDLHKRLNFTHRCLNKHHLTLRGRTNCTSSYNSGSFIVANPKHLTSRSTLIQKRQVGEELRESSVHANRNRRPTKSKLSCALKLCLIHN